MKKLFIVAALFVSCQKQEVKKAELLKSTLHLSSEYVAEQHSKGIDSLYVVSGSTSYAFQTYNDPCLSHSFTFSVWSVGETTQEFTISSDRKVVEVGVLKFTTEGITKSL